MSLEIINAAMAATLVAGQSSLEAVQIAEILKTIEDAIQATLDSACAIEAINDTCPELLEESGQLFVDALNESSRAYMATCALFHEKIRQFAAAHAMAQQLMLEI